MNFLPLTVQLVFRPTGFADLAAKRVGIFGYGVEGHATAELLRPIVASLVIVDDAHGLGDSVLVTTEGGHDALLTCDVVLKSPGIPRRRADVLDLEAHNVAVCSALNLWLHDIDRSRVVAVTGTKGKSTTTALITFFLRCLDEDARALGNFGQPPYDRAVDTSSGWLVVEVSSYQCVDIDVAPQLVVVTSLGADHLDWHGSLEQYHADKLSLTRADGWHRTLVPESSDLRTVADQLGGDVTFVDADSHELAGALGLLGAHNASNVALGLAAVQVLTGQPLERVTTVVTERASAFEPLRGRLTLIANESVGVGRVLYVDDGLATAPLPTVAALDVFCAEPVALLTGGFDRGVDYAPLATALSMRRRPTLVLTMGEAGRRLGDALRTYGSVLTPVEVESMSRAVHLGRHFVRTGGVVLFSPAAPSFDHYRNWEERSNDFTRAVRQSLERDPDA